MDTSSAELARGLTALRRAAGRRAAFRLAFHFGLFQALMPVLGWWLGTRVAAGLGINVNQVFSVTFAVGSGLAGLGGALGAEVLGLDPSFPLKFMIYFLIVVSVGGTTTITGPLLAALLLGIADVMGKYYVPQLGAFVVYLLMVVILFFRPQGLFGRGAAR